MDGSRFDTLTRSLAATRSRRAVARFLGGLAVGGSLARLGMDDAPAKKKRKGKNKKKSTKKNKARCSKRCGAGCSTCYDRPNGSVLCGGIASALCAEPCDSDLDCPMARPICTTGFTIRAAGQRGSWGCSAACTNVAPCEHCEDGVKNGGETDVDCGGPDCPRCGTGKACQNRDDCATAHCVNNVCKACASNPECGSSGGDVCNCGGEAPGVCWSSRANDIAHTCAECPGGTAVCFDATEEFFGCQPYCAA
jgi:hypothetical protein